jgi:hypothetical protein
LSTAVDNLSNPIINCSHFSDKDGFLLSTIPFLKVVPTPTPTTTLILQVPQEDADAASELASEPNPCSVKQDKQPITTSICDTLCDRFNTTTTIKKLLTTAECMNLLLGKDTLSNMIRSGFISDVALTNMVALQRNRF